MLAEISSIGIESHRQALSPPTFKQQIVEVTKQLRLTVDKLSNSQVVLDCQEDNQLLSSLQFTLCHLYNLFRPKLIAPTTLGLL